MHPTDKEVSPIEHDFSDRSVGVECVFSAGEKAAGFSNDDGCRLTLVSLTRAVER